MNKLFSSLFLLSFSIYTAVAQCVMVPLSLSERVNSATCIVEALVQSKTSYWNAEHSMIFTSNQLLIGKVYKGSEYISGTKMNITTSGGIVGMNAIKVEPELELEIGEIGIFLLVNKNGEWVSESGVQGFIRIDKHNALASDVFNTYPAFSIQSGIQSLTGLDIKEINSSITKVTISSKRASPSITSISPKTITSGTSSVLTIKGSNFNATIDTSSVQFKNADLGGASYVKALKKDYISWSDTMIKLIVRSMAGTGKIRLVIAGNGIANSTDTLKVSYSHLNVVIGDSIAYETQQIGMNNANGITWKMNRRFYDSSGARGAFIRSLERWRCGTFINWDTLGQLSHSAIKADGVNMCAWDTNSNMPSGTLAQCFSYWSGCFTPGLKWYVNELDIRFRVKPTGSTNWNYTTGNATSTQFHFESVATHELGHGHQMGHVINSAVVMHFSIANGQTKPGLSSDDINAGNYVINKSSGSICGKNGHSKLNSGNCAIVAPNANFRLGKNLICKNESVVFTDSSTGNISVYAWNFGSGASPATANTKGPHTVQYSTGGNKTISLTITTITGNLLKSKTLQVQNDSKMIPDFNTVATEKGNVSFTNNSNNSTGDRWYFGDGDSSASSSPIHAFKTGGTFNVRLIATNTCNTDDTIKPLKFAWLNFNALKSSACIKEPIAYIDSSDNSVATWTWSFPGGIPSGASGKGPHIVEYNTPGNKNATLNITVSGAAGQSYTKTNVVTIGSDTFSKADFIYGYYGKNIVGFENHSIGSAMGYKWYFGDGDSSSEKDPVHTYNNASLKTVRLIVKGNCGNDDTIVQLRDFTGISEVSNVNLIKIYPNPSTNSIRIISDLQGQLDVQICDLSGRVILISTANDSQIIDIRSLFQGTYLIKVLGENGVMYNAILIKN